MPLTPPGVDYDSLLRALIQHLLQTPQAQGPLDQQLRQLFMAGQQPLIPQQRPQPQQVQQFGPGHPIAFQPPVFQALSPAVQAMLRSGLPMLAGQQ